LHGYGILLQIGEISGNALLIEQGALYPGLFSLVKQGLRKTNWVRRKTTAGPSSTISL
jgi:PadR family transcriptional regulator, regulatory protein PadR